MHICVCMHAYTHIKTAEDRSNSTQRKTAHTTAPNSGRPLKLDTAEDRSNSIHACDLHAAEDRSNSTQRKTAQTRHSGRPFKLDTAEDRSNSTHQRKTALACFQLPTWTLHHISLPTGSRCRTAQFIRYHLDMTHALRTWSIHNLNTESPARNTGSTMASTKICT